MNIKTRASKMSDEGKENGWVITFADGKRQFMRGISRMGAFRTGVAYEKEGRKVESIRALIITGDGRDRVYTILA